MMQLAYRGFTILISKGCQHGLHCRWTDCLTTTERAEQHFKDPDAAIAFARARIDLTFAEEVEKFLASTNQGA